MEDSTVQRLEKISPTPPPPRPYGEKLAMKEKPASSNWWIARWNSHGFRGPQHGVTSRVRKLGSSCPTMSNSDLILGEFRT